VPRSYVEDNRRYEAAERIGPELRVEISDQEMSVVQRIRCQATTKQADVEDFILRVTLTAIFRVVIINSSYDLRATSESSPQSKPRLQVTDTRYSITYM
jgi:hypothetical protein